MPKYVITPDVGLRLAEQESVIGEGCQLPCRDRVTLTHSRDHRSPGEGILPLNSDSRGPAYRIHTERTTVRCWAPTDAPLLKKAIDSSLDHLRPWMPWAKHEPEDLPAKVERLRTFRGTFDLGQDFIYGIFDRDERMVLGGTGLDVEERVS